MKFSATYYLTAILLLSNSLFSLPTASVELLKRAPTAPINYLTEYFDSRGNLKPKYFTPDCEFLDQTMYMTDISYAKYKLAIPEADVKLIEPFDLHHMVEAQKKKADLSVFGWDVKTLPLNENNILSGQKVANENNYPASAGKAAVHVLGFTKPQADRIHILVGMAQDLARKALNDLNNNRGSGPIYQKYFSKDEVNQVLQILNNIVNEGDLVIAKDDPGFTTYSATARMTTVSWLDGTNPRKKGFILIKESTLNNKDPALAGDILHEITHLYGTKDVMIKTQTGEMTPAYDEDGATLLRSLNKNGVTGFFNKMGGLEAFGKNYQNADSYRLYAMGL